MTLLSERLSAALISRDHRLIHNRLPQAPSDTLKEIEFMSNDFLSLSSSPELRQSVLSALAASPKILGSGGSRLVVPLQPHLELEARLRRFFGAESALLFNSGFDVNVGLFSAIAQPGDVIVYDAHIHASVHDGMRLSRLASDALIPFSHNSVRDLRTVLSTLLQDRDGFKKGTASVFIAVESLYSMDGTIAPLVDIVECVEELLPLGNRYIIVDEAHATGVYGPKGRGMVVGLGLENRVFARLHTFGKALAASGAVLLTTKLVREYLLNYARSLVYMTSLSFANVVAIDCSFDMLEDGTTEARSAHVLALSTYFLNLLRSKLKHYPPSLLRLPDYLASAIPEATEPAQPWQSETASPWATDPHTPTWSPRLPTPIIPLLTPDPRVLSNFLLAYAAPSGVELRTMAIYPPTVPRGTARLRICLRAGHMREDVDLLAQEIVAWAETRVAAMRRMRRGVCVGAETLVAAKL